MIIDIGDKVKVNLGNGITKNAYVESVSDGFIEVIEEETHYRYSVFCEDVELIPGENFFKTKAEEIAKKKNEEKTLSSHYAKMEHPPVEITNDWPIQQQIGAMRFGALKYIIRLGYKDAAIDESEKLLDFAFWLNEVLKGNKIYSNKRG